MGARPLSEDDPAPGAPEARPLRRLRGLKALVHDAVDATTELVREGHESTARVVRRVTDRIEPLAEPVAAVDEVRRLGTAGVLASVRGVNRAVEVLTDLGLDAAERALPAPAAAPAALPMRSDATRSAAWVGDAALGLVNAAVGDHLRARGNGLDLDMLFRARDRYVDPSSTDELAAALPAPSRRLALFVHGLGTTEWSWCLEADGYHGDPATTFGTLLEHDLGFTPVYVRYNTGRRVAHSGRALAEGLERLFSAYPVGVEDLTLIGHSMGGLVARSACHHGLERGHRWVGGVRRVFCLGSPHRGAPLARLGDGLARALGAVDLPGTRIGARILEGRSAGVKDLQHGAIVDADFLDVDAEALAREAPRVPDARHYFLAATVTPDPDHPLGRLLGDLMVRVESAEGPVVEHRSFPIETGRHGGMMHHQLQNHPSVYEQIRRACAGE